MKIVQKLAPTETASTYFVHEPSGDFRFLFYWFVMNSATWLLSLVRWKRDVIWSFALSEQVPGTWSELNNWVSKAITYFVNRSISKNQCLMNDLIMYLIDCFAILWTNLLPYFLLPIIWPPSREPTLTFSHDKRCFASIICARSRHLLTNLTMAICNILPSFLCKSRCSSLTSIYFPYKLSLSFPLSVYLRNIDLGTW